MSRVADVHPVPNRLATQVAFSTFHQAAPFTRELLQGYERARVVTYSASLNTVRWLIGQVGALEVVMGEARLAVSLASLAAYQHLLLEELGQDAQAQGEGAPLFLDLREGRLRVYVLREAVSHAKLYLLEKGDQTRVITGSANLSDRALFDPQAAGAAQHEHLTVYEINRWRGTTMRPSTRRCVSPSSGSGGRRSSAYGVLWRLYRIQW